MEVIVLIAANKAALGGNLFLQRLKKHVKSGKIKIIRIIMLFSIKVILVTIS